MGQYYSTELPLAYEEFITAFKMTKDDVIKEAIGADSFSNGSLDIEGITKVTRLMQTITKLEDLLETSCRCMDAQYRKLNDMEDRIKEITRKLDQKDRKGE